MNNIKRGMILILACVMLFGAAVACGGSKGETASTNKDSIVIAEPDANPQQGTESGNVPDENPQQGADPENTQNTEPESRLKMQHKTIDASEYHVVAIKEDGTVVAAGGNYSGECDVAGWTDIISVCAGDGFTVGLKADGTVVACGKQSRCGGVENWTDIAAIAAGAYHVVGLKKDGTVVACGENGAGQCYTFATDDDPGLWSGIVAIAAGRSFSYGLRSDGTTAYAGNYGDSYARAASWEDLAAIQAVSPTYLFGWKTDGTVICTDWNIEERIYGWTDIESITICQGCVFGLKTDGSILTYNSGSWINEEIASGVSGLKDIDALCGSQYHVVAVRRDGTAVVAYDQAAGGIGEASSWSGLRLAHPENRTAAAESTMQPLNLERKVMGNRTISAGGYHAAAIRNDGTVVTCSMKSDGRYWDVSGWSDIVSIDQYEDCLFGLKADGTVVSCLLQNTEQSTALEPVSIFEGDMLEEIGRWTDIVAIGAGQRFLVGLKKDGTLVGAGTSDNSYAHTYDEHKWGGTFYWDDGEISDWTNIVAICVEGMSVFGLKADGTVVACGDNYGGQCNVSGWTDIVAIACGFQYTVGLKKDGTVVATSDAEELRALSGWTDIVSVSASEYRVVGVKKDGTVVTTSNMLTYIDDWTGIVEVGLGYEYAVGLRADGTVVARGNITHGQDSAENWTDIRLP